MEKKNERLKFNYKLAVENSSYLSCLSPLALFRTLREEWGKGCFKMSNFGFPFIQNKIYLLMYD